MFTGLIQAIGTIHLHGKRVLVKIPSEFDMPSLGDSISVDGVCLTVSALTKNSFLADVSEETLDRTSLGKKANEKAFVNLEPALRLSDRLGGHLVSGHVDGLGRVLSIKDLRNSWDLQICWENNIFAKYTCDKASVALNGVSLTVAKSKKEDDSFSIAVIPHTWGHTALQYLKVGETINLEADLMAKYAESILNKGNYLFDSSTKSNEKYSDISSEWLVDNGFL
ncbi:MULTISPECIES: riboflavin synthase [unclassified Prochlorococcus]|uniref:riboflavin synthase n=1 Tax=unclassified Prochlorococcus TaxID=2627481 RepID=UPI00053389D4|nr:MULTISPECIES: riboflavin synthase [unclassified Prochlorococcus]KGG16519.1 Riboflavin synthase eubacterial/eukaryotic [Prochlorococcus sp. MIT 0602]KGG17005.1 Riboflavin synthase eubacterial/eukaryotic [Prochlorococcus sp. MIT 0603]